MTESIRSRRSVRTFDGTPLREEDAAGLLAFADKVENHFELGAIESGLHPVMEGTDPGSPGQDGLIRFASFRIEESFYRKRDRIKTAGGNNP